MKLFGVMVVQNEGDVIEDTLRYLRDLDIYETIFFYDLGSSDDTFSKALKHKDILYKPQILNEIYTEKLRYDLLAQNKKFYKKGDWLAIIDADEFYVDNPVDLIEIAESETATSIKTYQAEFMLTDVELDNFDKEDHTLPIFQRRNYYLIDWSEERFYKFLSNNGPFSSSKPCSRRLLNRHYQYRNPDQIKTRIKTRLENRKKARNIPGGSYWAQVFSDNWKDYIISHKILHLNTNDKFEFGIPEGVEWKDYYTKNPSFSLFPQIAIALMQEQLNSENIISKNNYTAKINVNVPFQIKKLNGLIAFPDSYSEKVVKETKVHLQKFRWKQFIRCVIVLIRYHILLFRKYASFKSHFVAIRTKDTLWNLNNYFKRLMLRKGRGIISAKPNPIKLSDFSGAGTSTLSWKSKNTKRVEVRIDRPDGEVLSGSEPSGSITTNKCVHHGTVFYLQDLTDGLPLTSSNTLAKVTVTLFDESKTIVI